MSFATFPTSLPYFEELHQNDLLEQLIKSLSNIPTEASVDTLTISEKVEKHPFMEAFDKTANYTRTSNGALTNATTRDSIIDLYYGIQAVDTTRKSNDKLFENAWKQDPDMTLHIIFYARSIHRGKSTIVPFLKAYGWLLRNHPQSALKNLHLIIDPTIRTGAQLAHWRKAGKNKTEAENGGWDTMDSEVVDIYKLLDRRDFKTHGYWKDLCTLLTIYCQGELDGPKNNNTYSALQWPRKEFDAKNYREQEYRKRERYQLRKAMLPEDAFKDAEKYIELNEQHNREQRLEAQKLRRETRLQRQRAVCVLLKNDRVYRSLHFTVARLFADQLKKDLQQMEINRVMVSKEKLKGRHALGFNLSLAAKWAPTLGASHDKHTLLATSIAELLFPPNVYQENGESRVHYVNKVRELYRKHYLGPLRNALDITEHYMQDGQWEKVDISHIPSVCLAANMVKFMKNAPELVIDYMQKVALGKAKVSGETISPHQLVHRYRTRNTPDKDLLKLFELRPSLREEYTLVQQQLLNGQWQTLIGSLRDTSLLKSSSIEESKRTAVNLGECIAVCDVSGSMKYNKFTTDPELMPLNAAIGLSLVITNLAKPPFNGAVITFSKNPTVFKVDTEDTFMKQVRTIMKSPMGFNTDLAKVFTEVLLPMAKDNNLAPEDMVKKIFIFSDMEFDGPYSRVGTFDRTTQEFIRSQFKEAGYETPEIVWWNLCADGTYASYSEMNAPVTKDDVDVTLLSGFSAAMIKTFLDGEEFKGDTETDDDMDFDMVEEEQDVREVVQQTENVVKQPRKKETVMDFVKRAVYHESFSGIVVID